MFKHLEEKEFCKKYKELEKSFRKHYSYKLAVEILQLNSEEYKAVKILKKNVAKINFNEQLQLTEKILDRNIHSFLIWQYRMYLIREYGLKKEDDIKFIKKILKVDNRNSMCWVYICKIYDYFPEVANSAISESISNYSAYFSFFKCQDFSVLKALKNIIFTDPEISSPWVFLRLVENNRRFNSNNYYLKVFSTRIQIYLENIEEIVVYITQKGKVLEYSAEFKRIITIEFKEEYAFSDISRLEIKNKKKSVTFQLKVRFTPEIPEYIDEFIKAHPTVESYITKLYFTYDQLEREEIIKKLLEMDKKRKQMYLEMKESFEIYCSTE